MRILALCAAISFLGLAGCSGSKSAPSDSTPKPTASNTEPNDPGSSEPNKVDPPKPSATKTPPLPTIKPDPAAYEIEKTGDGSWKIVTLKGPDLARKVAGAMVKLNGTAARTLTTLTIPAGSGQVQADVKIRDRKTYSIQYPIVGDMPELCEVVANGTTKAYKGPTGTIDTKKAISSPGPDAEITPSQMIQKWPLEFPRLLYRGVVEGKDPWGPLISQLTAPSSGFKTEISERTMTYKNKPLRSLRLVATRKPDIAKKLGACSIEMVFDGTHYLPVTIRVNSQVPNKGQYKILWSTHWLFKKTFKPEDFKI